MVIEPINDIDDIDEEEEEEFAEEPKQRVSRGKVDGSSDGYALYVDQMNAYPLLTKEEEARLAQAILSSRSLEASQDQKEEGELAKQKLITSNLRLVLSVAKRFTHSGVPFLDLVNAGNLGLIDAANKYDVSVGTAFSTYAYRGIYNAINDFVRLSHRATNISTNKDPKAKRIFQAYSSLAETYSGGNVSYDDVAEALGDVTPEEVKQVLSRATGMLVSLDAPLGKDKEDGDTQESMIQDEDSSSLSIVEEGEKIALIQRALSCLNEEEKSILVQLYGLDGEEPKTLDAVGDSFHLSRERIRQKRERALLKIRAYLQSEDIHG